MPRRKLGLLRAWFYAGDFIDPKYSAGGGWAARCLVLPDDHRVAMRPARTLGTGAAEHDALPHA